ncbi:MAG: hypothetical protein IPH06_04340 [Alphaproteobacteria bacterium]|nr:hypothetical protein [Alphaproteobacteria bacterium]QQS57262.1 MAG: hypothetical protein IPN28_00100 [Alphaproteobacteria bacterium]
MEAWLGVLVMGMLLAFLNSFSKRSGEVLADRMWPWLRSIFGRSAQHDQAKPQTKPVPLVPDQEPMAAVSEPASVVPPPFIEVEDCPNSELSGNTIDAGQLLKAKNSPNLKIENNIRQK